MTPSHGYAIDALTAETGWPIQEVSEMFMRELARLRVGARVEDYLVLLASRHVREDLRGSLDPRRNGIGPVHADRRALRRQGSIAREPDAGSAAVDGFADPTGHDRVG